MVCLTVHNLLRCCNLSNNQLSLSFSLLHHFKMTHIYFIFFNYLKIKRHMLSVEGNSTIHLCLMWPMTLYFFTSSDDWLNFPLTFAMFQNKNKKATKSRKVSNRWNRKWTFLITFTSRRSKKLSLNKIESLFEWFEIFVKPFIFYFARHKESHICSANCYFCLFYLFIYVFMYVFSASECLYMTLAAVWWQRNKK